MCYRSRCPGPEESADEDEEDSIWRDLRDRSLADARKSRPLNPSSKIAERTRSILVILTVHGVCELFFNMKSID